MDTTAKVGEIFFRVCFYSGPAYKTRPRKSKKIFFGVGGHDQRGRCRRLLAPLPQRRAFVVLTVYEVRDLLAQVPDGAEARRLAPYCFDTTDKATGQVAAVVGWLGHAAVEEWGWRKVKLRAADAGALQSLRIITLLHRGSAEWYRVDGEPVPPVETDPVSPWSPPVRQVWAAVYDAVYDEQDRAKDEADDLEASFCLPAAAPQDRP